MNKLYLALLLYSFTAYPQWNYVGSAGISQGWTMHNDIVTDTSGKPVIVFSENSIPKTSVLEWDGNAWIQTGAASYPNFNSGSNQLLVGSLTNNYYLFYTDDLNQFPSVLKYNGQSWSYPGSQYITNSQISHPAIALDQNEVIYTAFITPSGLKIYSLQSNSWIAHSTAGLPSPIAWLSMTFDQNNILHVTYTDMNSLKAGCMSFNGLSWVQAGNANFSGGYAQYNKIVCNANNDLYVAYDDGQTNCVKLNKITNSWENTGILGMQLYSFWDLITDNAGSVYLTALKPGSDKVRCLKYSGTAWTEIGPQGVSDTTAAFYTLAGDKNGVLYTTYNDWESGKAVVKKYDPLAGLQTSIFDQKLILYPNPTRENVLVNNPNHATIQIDICNSSAQLLKTIVSSDITVEINGLQPGLYFISIRDGEKRKLFKLIVQD
jgi:hypothetical protein